MLQTDCFFADFFCYQMFSSDDPFVTTSLMLCMQTGNTERQYVIDVLFLCAPHKPKMLKLLLK